MYIIFISKVKLLNLVVLSQYGGNGVGCHTFDFYSNPSKTVFSRFPFNV